jgi:hypothetical protein
MLSQLRGVARAKLNCAKCASLVGALGGVGKLRPARTKLARERGSGVEQPSGAMGGRPAFGRAKKSTDVIAASLMPLFVGVQGSRGRDIVEARVGV